VQYALLFPGQGSQFIGMGRAVAGEWRSADELFNEADRCTGLPIRRLCFYGPEEELLMTANLQPCIVATSLAVLTAACEEAGIGQVDLFELQRFSAPPAFVAGHSVGEYSALVASGVLSVSECMELVAFRGSQMEQAAQRRPGTMVAMVAGSVEAAQKLCDDICTGVDGTFLDIANYNSQDQIILAGDLDSVNLAAKCSAEYGFRRALPLRVSGAFHSVAMRPASDAIGERLLSVPLATPMITVVGNVGGEPIMDIEVLRKELSVQVAAPVQWANSMSYMDSQGVREFFEVGPGRVLSRLATKVVAGAVVSPTGDLAGVRALASRLSGN